MFFSEQFLTIGMFRQTLTLTVIIHIPLRQQHFLKRPKRLEREHRRRTAGSASGYAWQRDPQVMGLSEYASKMSETENSKRSKSVF